MSTKKGKNLEFIDRALDLPTGTVGGGATVILHSDREVIVDGCRSVISCSEEEIKLNVGNRGLLIKGRGLIIKVLTDREITLSGSITALEFC